MADTNPKAAHPANAPGDFYVENQCCTLCGVPQALAPELFSTPAETSAVDHCYVRRQPATDTEINQMLDVISGAELQCIRYAGNDQSILDRIIAAGESAVCDAIPQRPPQPRRFQQWIRRALRKST